MKKRILWKSFCLPAMILAFVSCGEEELLSPASVGIAYSSPDAVLEEVQVSQIVTNGHVYDFKYGSNEKLEEVSSFYQSEENEEGISYKLSENYTLVYAGDRLKEVNKEFTYTRNLADGTQELESGLTKVAYLYKEDGLVREVQKIYSTEEPNGTTRETIFSQQYEYNQDKKVVKLTGYTNGKKSSEYSTLEWSGDNLMKHHLFYAPDDEGQRQLSGREPGMMEGSHLLRPKTSGKEALSEEVRFSDYDDKINPMKLFAVLFGNSAGITRTENNAGKIIKYQAEENGSLVESEVTTITHTYDNEGRPVRYNISTTIHDLDATYETEYTLTYRD